jgi:hypothetical protein
MIFPRLLKLVLLLALAGYVGVLVMLYARQREMVFPRDPARADIALAGLAAAEEASVITADGERLVAWVVPPRAGKPVVLYFHGNAGNLGRAGRLERFRGSRRMARVCSPSAIAAMAARPARRARRACCWTRGLPMALLRRVSEPEDWSATANLWVPGWC